MKELNAFRKFINENEDSTLAENFDNDMESRYAYIRPLMVDLDDSSRTEAMIDGMEDAMMEDDKEAFDFYFVETMKMLGLEQELMDPEDVMYEGNDDVLDEILKEEKFNVIVKDTGEIIDDGLPKDLATKLAAKKNGWVIQKVEEALDEVKDAKFEVGDKVKMKAGGEEMEIVGARRMFGNNTQAYKVKKADGETVEYSANQLKKCK